jgi:hypothetical protein
MRYALPALAISGVLTLSSCAAGPSTEAVRQQITTLADAELSRDDVIVERVIAQTENVAVAETTLKLALQYAKDDEGQWQIVAARLGDGRWVEVGPLLAAVEAFENDQTTASLAKLVDGVNTYVERNGNLPVIESSGYLSDVLHPLFMSDLVRVDAWGSNILYEAEGDRYRLSSPGPDGLPGTQDDIVMEGEAR